MWLGSNDWKAVIADGATQLGIPLQGSMIDQFAAYASELAAWNRVTNITTITKPKEIAIKHFLDSIAPLSILPFKGSLLDIGTGGGFPGLPLKIAMPALAVTLVDASRKKISFVKHVIRILGLRNTDAVQTRFEAMPGQVDFHRRYDIIVCRAFSHLKVFIERARPLLASHGVMLAYKGRQVAEELAMLGVGGDPKSCQTTQAVTIFREIDIEVVPYTLPFLTSDRALVMARTKD